MDYKYAWEELKAELEDSLERLEFAQSVLVGDKYIAEYNQAVGAVQELKFYLRHIKHVEKEWLTPKKG